MFPCLQTMFRFRPGKPPLWKKKIPRAAGLGERTGKLWISRGTACSDFLKVLHVVADAIAALMEGSLFGGSEGQLDDLLHAICAQNAGHAREQTGLSVLAVELHAGGHDGLFVVQHLPEKVTQPPLIDSFVSASRSKRKRSSVLAHSSSGMPRKLTHDQGANCWLPCSPSM